MENPGHFSVEINTPKGWIAADDIDFGSILKRHGSILPITDSEYRAILESFGRSNYSRDCRPH